MMKRMVAVLLTAFIILSAGVTAVSVVVAPKLPFVIFNSDDDSLYARALEDALKPVNEINNNVKQENTVLENPYMIKFSENVSQNEIKNALKDVKHEVVSDNLFRVSVESPDFMERNSHIIQYAEKDELRQTFATVNDPAAMTSHNTLSIFNAWDKATARDDIIVAVLDTGVSRNHEDLKNVNILAGYDAVARKAGVYEDSDGHGTGVTGIIAATANNNLGIAGVAYGVTILPVKVSSSGTTIYSSDLVRGIRFAADAGAKIINMSIGGYSSSFAEQEAVNYAISKGCILISAAGNGGMSEYATQKCYPASYDGVISVASCNDNGEHSAFSQYNDKVDITATGENITMPIMGENGESVYRTDSGTSYACAFVSGIAALAVSHVGDNVRFENAEFNSLLADLGENQRDDKFGYGIINAETVITLSEMPIITGVVNGESYSSGIKIGFNRGTATLGGDSIEDGETIIANGNHTLTVTDGSNTKTLKFRLDYTPLSYEFKEFSNYAYFKFDRGSAMLDGFPYKSEEKITVSGRHEFVISDGEEKRAQTINLRYSLPTVYGVAHGETYNSPIEITVIGDGNATLNGESFNGTITVAQSGNHTLTVTSGNGAVEAEYDFTINFPQGIVTKTDYANGKAAVDEENGFICLYGESLVGVRIYDINSPDSYLHFLPVGKVYGHAFHNENLLLFGVNGITVLNRATALKGQDAVVTNYNPEQITYFTYEENNVFGFGYGNMYAFDLEMGEISLIAQLGFDCKKAFYSNGEFYLVPESGSQFYVYSFADNSVLSVDLGVSLTEKSICFGSGYISVNNLLFSSSTGELVLEFAGHNAIRIDHMYVYTENSVIDISKGNIIGSLPFDVSCIVSTATKNYIYGVTPQCAIVTRDADGLSSFAAATHNDMIFSDSENSTVYRENIYYSKYNHVISVASAGTTIYSLHSDRNSLYRLNTSEKRETDSVPLKYIPEKVICSGGYVVVTFQNANYVYIAAAENDQSGKYLRIPSPCSNAAVINGRLFTLINGKIYVTDIENGRTVESSVSAQIIASHGETLYAVNENTLSSYNYILSKQDFEISVIPTGELLFGNGIALSRSVYDITTGEFIAKTDSRIIAYKGNTVVDENGVFDVLSNSYIGNTGLYSPEFVTICGNNSVAAFGNGTVSINYCAEGDEVTTNPNVKGIEDFRVYSDNTTITYAHGVGYLNGVPLKSGEKVSEIGTHLFTLSLPCGRNISIQFSIEAPLSGIAFLGGNKTMSVGETISLKVIYLPEGASSIPVTFKCDSENITIDENGNITALAVGEYTITARAKSENGDFSAKCKITVRDDIIAVSPQSGLKIDRNNSLITDIPAGTKVSQFVTMLTSNKNISIKDKNGKNATGYIGTGFEIVLTDNDGNIKDTLYAVIRSDTDGDGFISANDLYELQRILQGYEYSAPFISAADINGNGVTADNDFRALKKILLGRTDSVLGNAENSLLGNSYIQTISRIESDDIIDMVVCLNGTKGALGIYGSFDYNENLEFIEVLSTGWVTDCYDHGGKISFYAYNDKNESDEQSFKTLLNIRFRVKGFPAEKIEIYGEKFTVSFKDKCKTIPFENYKSTIYPKVYNDFQIVIKNATNFKFDKSIHDYEITIPYDNAVADISVTHKTNEVTEITSLVVSDNREETITVSYTNENGNTEFYNFNVNREKAPVIDTNCKLKVLEVEGHPLTPIFNPEYSEYSISVPYGTEKVNLYCIAQNETASVFVSDTHLQGENTTITVTVGALDGETMVYTLNVTMEPEPIVSTPDEQPIEIPNEKNPFPYWTFVLIGISVLAAVAIVVKLKRK